MLMQRPTAYTLTCLDCGEKRRRVAQPLTFRVAHSLVVSEAESIAFIFSGGRVSLRLSG